ncbi:hypothetical protein [Streptomyces atratus]|uniref:Lipoprotein n=1 Tax=Streptomyces atratus TaxID=1893 RepID=A0A2Z5JD87_STRAR|nr:hypothetical protein [Streptomyces atratus]AXE78346.1 hypothetical protein C5746_16995 [Streptomyces atratus]
MRPLARTAAAALCTVTALGPTAACDTFFDDARSAAPYARLTGPEVVNKALAATRGAKSVRMTVETTSPEGPVEAFVATDVRGECTVTLSMGAAGTMELVRTGGTVYTLSDAAMLHSAPASQARKLTGRWVKPATGDRHAKLAERYCDRETFLDLLAPKSGTAHKGRATAPGSGTPAMTVTGGTDDGKWTADIATDGRPFLLKLRLPHSGAGHGTDPVTVEFSAFDKPFTAAKPKT